MGMQLLVMLVVFGAVMYFLMIRPQQRRMREHQATIDALEPGSRVLLTSGVFATIQHIADSQMIVELAPGVEVTIVKQAIARVAREDEEEFEFTDEVIEEATEEEASADVEEAVDTAETATPEEKN